MLKGLQLFLIIAGGIGSVVIGDFFLKLSAIKDFGLNLFLGMLFYMLAAYPCALAFRSTDFGQLALLWESGMLAACMAVSVMFFREPITLHRVVGFILVILAILLNTKK